MNGFRGLATLPGLWLLSLLPTAAHTQYYFYNERFYDRDVLVETGMLAGMMNCLTDLGGHGGPRRGFLHDLNWNFSRPCMGWYAGILYRNSMGLTLSLTRGSIAAADSVLINDAVRSGGRYERNLSFRSPITEWQFLFELHPLYFFRDATARISPYFSAGVGRFRFNPRARLGANWYDLQPLHTEGQETSRFPHQKPYALQQACYPVGMGVRYEIHAHWVIRLEILHRFLRTDYLDDVSTTYADPAVFQTGPNPALALIAGKLADRRKERTPGSRARPGDTRGNPARNDSYFTIHIKCGFILGRKPR